MRYTLITILLGSFFLPISLTLSACAPTPAVNKAKPEAPIARVVYLFNSEACECERDRNEVAEGIMQNIAAAGATYPVERIDVAKRPTELERYQAAAGFRFLPVLLTLDTGGEVRDQLEGIFSEARATTLLALQPEE